MALPRLRSRIGGSWCDGREVVLDENPAEEIFGPVVAVLPAGGDVQVVALANDTLFGLTASLFTSDLGRALRFARDIRAGVVKVNEESAGVEFQVPFGGMKGSSSCSREQGSKVAREFFTEWKTVYLNPPGGATA